jgi:predicted phosphodiesterase
MRLALFSDIHGNVVGLRSVLEAIGALEPVDELVCAGDMLGGGGGHEDLIDLLLGRRVVMLRGNHEEGDLDIQRHLPSIPPEWRDWAVGTAAWLHRVMSAPYWRIIADLPLTHTVRAGPGAGGTILACHASPTDTRARVCGKDAPAAEVRAAYGAVEAAVIAHGHFHQQQVQLLDGKLLVNVASVGLRFDGRSAFTVLEYVNERWVVEQHEVDYDVREELDLLRRSGAPELDWELLRGPRHNRRPPV